MEKQQLVKIIGFLSSYFTLPFLYTIKYYFYQRFLGFRDKTWRFAFYALLLTLIDFYSIRILSEPLRIIIHNIIWLIIICSLCNGNFLIKFYAVIVEETILLLINLTFLTFDFNILPIIHSINMSFKDYITVSFINNIINDIIRIIILFVFLKSICKLINFKGKLVNLYQGLYLLVPCLSIYSLGIIFYIIQTIRIDNKKYYLPYIFPKIYYILPFVSFSLLISILIVAYTFKKMLQCEQEQQKSILMKEQFKLQLKHSKNIEELYNNIRSIKHDMNNHLSCLKNLINTNNITETQKYIDNISKTINKLDFEIKTGNCISDTIINEKYNIAKSKGIDFICDFILPNKISLEPIDLCIILGNTLDNAIEACTKITHDNILKTICIKSYIRNMYLIIEVSNTTINKLQYDKNKIISTKSDKYNHGIGISNIEAVVKKYNGIIDILEEKDKFTINLMLKIK
ncbi:sensor histidine kinase [Haloimpatiens sp. FM7330]|uniref:sensor histidine kinase n=1 Tax=Haloimpatiens sp. FM7330 TaxID=3298610 RepID=UPI00364018F7